MSAGQRVARRPRTPGASPRVAGAQATWLFAWLAAALAALALLLAAGPAFAAFTPPALEGHVVDTAGKLTREEALALDRKLDAVRRRTGFEIVAFVVGSLEGEPIEDVAFKTFNAWQIGQGKVDNGVLLVIAPAERRVRIETGKGVGGALTDLQSNDIIRERIAPLLQKDRFRDAVDQGTDAITQALVAGSPGSPGSPGAKPPPPRGPDLVSVGIGAGALVLVIFLSIVSPGFRSILWLLIHALLWSSGRGGGGGGGGSGYGGGGGGRSGGGGSSDSY